MYSLLSKVVQMWAQEEMSVQKIYDYYEINTPVKENSHIIIEKSLDMCNLCNKKPISKCCWDSDCNKFGDMGEYCDDCFNEHNKRYHDNG